MVQELGETRQEMMKTDAADIEKILNRRGKDSYFIVIHHKNTRMTVKGSGEQVLMRLVKDYDKRPQNLLGTIIMEVKDGEIIDTKINLHDIPVDWGLVEAKAGLIDTPYIQHRPDISNNYIYNI